jgi:hypothetical protein
MTNLRITWLLYSPCQLLPYTILNVSTLVIVRDGTGTGCDFWLNEWFIWRRVEKKENKGNIKSIS